MSQRQVTALALALFLIPMLSAQTGLINTVAGTGVAGTAGVGGPASSAQLYQPGGVCIDSADNLYIADKGNHRVVRVDAATGTLTLIAGNRPQPKALHELTAPAAPKSLWKKLKAWLARQSH